MNPIQHATITLNLLAVLFTSFAAATAAGSDDTVVLRFAILGDAEPKPEPEFPNLDAEVQQVNSLAASGRLDFVVGVGDIANKGRLIQYEKATPVLHPDKGIQHPGFQEVMCTICTFRRSSAPRSPMKHSTRRCSG